MLEWVFVLAIIAIVFVVLKVASKKQEFAVTLTLALFIFLALTLGYVYISSHGDLTSVSGVENFASTYYSWMGSLFGNIKTATSNAISMDWSVKNQTK